MKWCGQRKWFCHSGYRCLGLRSLPEIAGRAEQHPRERIEAFIQRVLGETGNRITKAAIWRVAGYKERTQFQRFQTGRRVSRAATANFGRVLNMAPADFMARLTLLVSAPEQARILPTSPTSLLH